MKPPGILPLVLAATCVLAPPVDASIVSKETSRQQALELLEGLECHDKIAGLRLLRRVDGQSEYLREQVTVHLLAACECPRDKALAFLIGLWPESGNLHGRMKQFLEQALASSSPQLRGVAALILAKAGLLPTREIHQGLRAAHEDELLFYCAVVNSSGEQERCDLLRSSFEARIEDLLQLPADELLSLRALLLADTFPAEAVNAALALAVSAHQPAQADALVLVREAWAESAAARLLDDSISQGRLCNPSALRTIEFFRLSTPASLKVVKFGLASSEPEYINLAIAAAAALGPAASDLVGQLKKLVLEPDGSYRGQAVSALVEISPSAAEHLAAEIKTEDQALYVEIKRSLLARSLD